ncbi:MAG: TlpA disulfide reductase family protein [Bacteroidales bacterium]
MKRIFLTLFTVVCFITAFAQTSAKTITIQGNVKFNDDKSKMKIFRIENSDKIIVGEFSIGKENTFNYQMKVEQPGTYTLSYNQWENLQFWAEDENIEVNFKGIDTIAMEKTPPPPFLEIINAGPKNHLMNLVNYNEYRNHQLMLSFGDIAYKADFKDDGAKRKFCLTIYSTLYADLAERERFLADKYYYLTSVTDIFQRLKDGKDQELIDKITKAHPNYAPLTKIIEAKKIAKENVEKMNIGNMAPDFKFQTADGKKNLGPLDFRGKYLLIDFWASWCAPCRSEIPHLKEYYELFKGKGVEFLSVSIDSKAEAWINAMDQEKMTWPQVLAPESGKTITKLYQFSGIPFIILLDKEGKIIAKQIRGENIKKLLEEVTK